jgi:hypothetical protein
MNEYHLIHQHLFKKQMVRIISVYYMNFEKRFVLNIVSSRDVRCRFTEHRHHRHGCHWRTDDPSATGALNHWKHRH